jgi:NitT/TauT family transport system ATP-binding protein
MTSTRPLIRATNIGYTYESKAGQSVRALSDISFTVKRGQVMSLIGPSGCGKSTALRLLAGLLKLDSGTIEFSGRQGQELAAAVSMIFQAPTLLPWRSVQSNVMIPLWAKRVPTKQARARAAEELRRVGLADRAASLPHQLSGGMQQRVALARALVTEPEVLLADEPFSALDALTRERLNLDLMRIWQQLDQTVILVTHSIEEAVLLSDTVAVMSAGPARITAQIDIDIERPRRADVVSLPQFSQYMTLLRELLFDAGQPASAHYASVQPATPAPLGGQERFQPGGLQ